MKSQQPEVLDERSKEKMKRAKKLEKRKIIEKGRKDYHTFSTIKERE